MLHVGRVPSPYLHYSSIARASLRNFWFIYVWIDHMAERATDGSPPCVYVACTDGHAIERVSQNLDLTARLAPSLAVTPNHRVTMKDMGNKHIILHMKDIN